MEISRDKQRYKVLASRVTSLENVLDFSGCLRTSVYLPHSDE